MDHPIFSGLEKLLKPIRSKFLNLIQRGILHKKEDSGFQVSLHDGDTQDNIKHLERFGFSSHPPENSEALLLFPAGERRLGFLIAEASPKGCPLTLKPGESAQYNEEGAFISLEAGSKIQIQTPEGAFIVLNKDQIEIQMGENASLTLHRSGKVQIKNESGDFVSAVVELANQVKEMTQYLVASSSCSTGHCAIIPPIINLAPVLKKLGSFQ